MMRVSRALDLLKEVEDGMKTPEFESALSSRRLNSSFALLGVQAVAAYLRGNTGEAIEDFDTLAAEIAVRRQAKEDKA